MFPFPVRPVAPTRRHFPLTCQRFAVRIAHKRASRCLTRRIKTKREDLRMFRHVKKFALFALAAASLLGAGNAQAAFPERPITLIVPWAAGGGTDAVARQIAHMLERDLKQPVNVVNRTG